VASDLEEGGNLIDEGSLEFVADFSQFRGTSLEEYGRFQQHLVLLEDYGRIRAFREAIESVPPGQVAVDVGAGTGVLGLLALAHGFERAILIEPSRKMATYARHLALINGLEDRVTIIEARLEDVDLDTLPRSIDLVVSETLSSLLFGFGSWDVLPRLADRTRDRRSVLPNKGRLLVAPVEKAIATRRPDTDGLALLSQAGLRIDLFDRAFRSAGNVFDKALIAQMLASGGVSIEQLASFDFQNPNAVSTDEGAIFRPSKAGAVGALLFWDVQLSGYLPSLQFTNLDPQVSSWYPYYIGFTRRIESTVVINLRLIPCDAPYTYAFQLVANGEPVTHVLYW
jgi:SAM-dependent methyltransferase